MLNRKSVIQLFFFGIILSFNYSFGQQQNIKQDSIVSSGTLIYKTVPIIPTFGINAFSLQNFIVQESKYPASISRTNTSKNVFVQVIIERDGKVTFDKIARGFNEKFDSEAKRIIEKMSDWKMENQ